jgi:alkanesulfonate monooxygenase SsuD/methylene tetrahydromethanopterin reductase-like flavin-dependent oxidoreductase (luciferase family)
VLEVTLEMVAQSSARACGEMQAAAPGCTIVFTAALRRYPKRALDLMGRMMGEYFLPLLGHFGFKDYLKHAPDVPDTDVTVDYCARHNWIVGSPSTVAEKIETVYREVGGFGTLLVFGFDYKHKPEAWHNSLRLLKQEVMPRLKHLDADLVRAA